MTAALHIAASFTCHSCGRCCRNSWDILVEPAARSAIAGSAAAQKAERSGYQPLVVHSEQTVATGRRKDGACVFLDAQQLCSLHAELGSQSKPLACRLYPYSIVATPSGYYASLSFACPSVVEGQGGELEGNRGELQHMLDSIGDFKHELPHQVTLRPGESISWGAYLALEPRILEAFRPEDPVVSLLDLAVAVLLTDGSKPWPDLRPAKREEPFEESMLAMFCASVIALWNEPERPELREEMSRAVLAGESIWSERHQITLLPFDILRAEPPWLKEIFQRYVDNAVFGKSLLARSVVSRLLALAIGSALVLYYADTFAHAQGSSQLSLEAVTRSFELVEADLVTHTQSLDPLFATFESTLCQVYNLEG